MSRRTRKRNRKTKEKAYNKPILLKLAILVFVLFFISIIFSLINIGNKNVINRVKIGEINVGGLSQGEATEKLNTWVNEVLKKDIIVKYENVEETIKTEKLLPEIEVDQLVKEAISIRKIW